MKGAMYNRYGGPDQLRVREVEQPVPKSNEVLIRVKASSVNPVDFKIRQGELKFITGKKFPRLVGADYSGEIVKTGASVTGYQAGDRVFGSVDSLKKGACAQYVTAKQGSFARVPASIPLAEAAALPVVALTALQGLRDKGNIGPGKAVLVNGSSGGVGTATLQMARYFKANITAVCSARNAELSRELGASTVIDYERKSPLGGGATYDIIFDAVANLSAKEARHSLKPRGVYITTVPDGRFIKEAVFSGLIFLGRAKTLFAKSLEADLKIIADMVDSGELKPIIEETYPLDRIEYAHRHAETGRVRGKLLILIP